MIKSKVFIAAIFVAAVGLAGCDTSSTDTAVAQIQNYTKLACAFVPTATTVSSILTSMNKDAAATNALASQVANAICDSLPKNSARGTYIPKVNGVPVYGDYVSSTAPVTDTAPNQSK